MQNGAELCVRTLLFIRSALRPVYLLARCSLDRSGGMAGWRRGGTAKANAERRAQNGECRMELSCACGSSLHPERVPPCIPANPLTHCPVDPSIYAVGLRRSSPTSLDRSGKVRDRATREDRTQSFAPFCIRRSALCVQHSAVAVQPSPFTPQHSPFDVRRSSSTNNTHMPTQPAAAAADPGMLAKLARREYDAWRPRARPPRRSAHHINSPRGLR
jgi:hypothetical protein